MSFSDLLAVYIGWVDRLIEPRPREVRAWDGFFTSRTASHADKIAAIAELFTQGEDLKPYLSPRVNISGYSPYSATRSGLIAAGKDRALNAYDTHHLHLVPSNEKGKRKGHSKELLFVKVKRDHVLFVMCGDHASFDDGTLRQAVSDLEVASGMHIRGISGVSRETDAREGEALARQGINTFTQSNGFYTAPSYLSSSLTSMNHRIHADRMLDCIEQWEPRLREEKGRKEICAEFSFPFSKAATFGWAVRYTTLYLVEEQSKRAVFQLPYHRR
ncbi:hypothetical protein V6R85_06045 [Agrobacterium sp. CCNWLW32]|uniref:hypothetical protein n=1 Tax=Agrobacterium sp. CCNWLW32 TaxID=3122072 RepID=UPI0030103630